MKGETIVKQVGVTTSHVLMTFGWMIVFVFTIYLVFLGFVIVKTGGTKGLRDVAVAMRAFRWPSLWRRDADRDEVTSGGEDEEVVRH